MSIKNLFNNKGTPKIQKTVSSDELVDQVESQEYIAAKKTEFEQFIPPIDFTTASNFAKFGSAELYYEKAFERIQQYYPYDGTLAEKTEFHNSASYLDKHVFDNIYPRTNGYVNLDGEYISVFGGPHTASSGMIGNTLESKFEDSMLYSETEKRTSAFEFRGEDGITIEFWLKVPNLSASRTIMEVTGGLAGDITLTLLSTDKLQMSIRSGSAGISAPIDALEDVVDGATDTWNHYAVTVHSSSAGLTYKGFKNGQLKKTTIAASNIPSILPVTDGLNMTIAALSGGVGNRLTGSLDEFRYWKKARTTEEIYNTWFIPVGGGTNKYDSNIALGLYFKFNEGITGTSSTDNVALDYSGRINNGTIVNYAPTTRNTGSAITEKLSEPEYLEPIIYSSHPDVVAKKAEYKTSGSLADLENSSMLLSYMPGWMQEEDEVNGKQLKYLCQVMGSYFDTLWHQISFLNRIHDNHYISGSNKALPFAKQLLYDRGFVVPDLFVDATINENLLKKDDNEVYEKQINEVRNIIYHNLYSNLNGIYKSKGTEKSFRNFFRSIGVGQDVVKLRMYADDSTFVLRNNYENKSYERKYLNFNYEGHFDATLYQTSSNAYTNNYLIGDGNYSGSFTLETEIVLPRKNRGNEVGYLPFTGLTASIGGFHTHGSDYTHPSPDYDLSAYVIKESEDTSLNPDDSHRVKFVLTGAFGEITSSFYSYQYENNKWNLAVRLRHENYPYGNVTGNIPNNYIVEFYGVEADGNTKRNSFIVSSSIASNYFSCDKIFYAGAHRTNFTGTSLYDTDIKLGFVRYWHSYLSNDAIDQHAYDSETFGANEPFENDLVNTYTNEVPREKTLAFHWAFNNLTTSDGSGELLVSDLSSGSADGSSSNYGSLSNTIERYIQGRAVGFNNNATNALDKLYLQIARKRLPDDLMSSDLTTIKSDEMEHFFVDEDVSDNFYSFEKSMYGTISDEMMNMFSTALDLNNLIGQPNQKYHHRYNLADFLRDRFYEDVENEPNIEKFTSFYKWIDDSISIALQQLTPASARFSEKINNIIESHVLERNKYVHQVPILTTFQSTEGSVKGITEMKYDWKHGHAPLFPDEEQKNALWQRERKVKTGLRENLRISKNNHSLQSSGLTRKEIDGSTRLGDTYALRRFGKLYDISIVSKNAIHGGINFSRQKNTQLFRESIAPSGEVGATSGTPQNIITVGVGDGDGVVRGVRDEDNPPSKRKYNSNALVGNKEGNEYGHKLQGDVILPLNLMSGTVHTGYNKEVKTNFASDVVFSNLHHDSVGNNNETSMQGPFTETHIGGLQYRHIDINKHDASKSLTVMTASSGLYASASIEFTASVLSTKLSEGTGSYVTIKDGDGTTITTLYSDVFDLYDNQWTNMDDLIAIIVNKLDVTANKISEHSLSLTQSVTGNYYNYAIQSSSHGFITASGFSGGSSISYGSFTRNLDGPANRPEGWAVVFKDHPSQGDNDGSFGFIGADYGSPYPSSIKLKATRYREETAKRPVNIKNIKTLTSSHNAGNYTNEIQIFSTAPVHQKTWAIEAYNDPNTKILPTSISESLPFTTHYQTLMGIGYASAGNVFGAHVNNRQPDGALHSPYIAGTFASGSFQMSGSRVLGVKASARFNATGAIYAGEFATGSFSVTSSLQAGWQASGSFDMSGAFSPAISASYEFQAFGKTIPGTISKGAFEVSGAYMPSAPSSASFNVYAAPTPGSGTYAIFDALFQTVADGDKFFLGKTGNTTAVEVNITGGLASFQNSEIVPFEWQKAAPVSGNYDGFSGSVDNPAMADAENFCLSMWVRIKDQGLNSDSAKFLYQAKRGGDLAFDVRFKESGLGFSPDERRTLYIRHFHPSTGSNLGHYGAWKITNFADADYSLAAGEWSNVTIFRFGSNEIDVFLNGVRKNAVSDHNHGSGGGWTYKDIDWAYHTVMSGNSPANYPHGAPVLKHDWSSSAGGSYVSDVMLWNSASQFSSPDGRQGFVNDMYRTGKYEPLEVSASLIGFRFKFGDFVSDPRDEFDPGDGSRVLGANMGARFRSTTGSSLSLASGAEFIYAKSAFVEKKTPTAYFQHLTKSILNHFSASIPFDAHFEEFQYTTDAECISTWFEEDLNVATRPGNVFTLPIGTTLNVARVFISSSVNSSAANYQINPSIDVYSGDANEKTFSNLKFRKTGSDPVNASIGMIEDSTLTIDSTVFRFDHHNNSASGNKIRTFDFTGSCLKGSQTGDVSYISSSGYPATSPIINNDMSISFWHARDSGDTNRNDIINFHSPSGPAAGALQVYSDNLYLYIQLYENGSTNVLKKVAWTSLISWGFIEDKDDLNNYVFTYETSSFAVGLHANGSPNIAALTTVGSISSWNHTFNKVYLAGNPNLSTSRTLEGRLDQVAVWDKQLGEAEAKQIYNEGRRRDLYGTTCAPRITHWWRLGHPEEPVPAPGATLHSVAAGMGGVFTYEDRTINRNTRSPRYSVTNIHVRGAENYSMASGLPTNVQDKNAFWSSLSSSIESNVSDYDVSFSASSNYATFTVTNEIHGPGGNGDSLSEASNLVYALDSTTAGGINATGAVAGDLIEIKAHHAAWDIAFTVAATGTVSTAYDRYIENTGSSQEFWNALSQSIKDHTVFDEINIVPTDDGERRIFNLTASAEASTWNNAIGIIGGATFKTVSQTAGGSPWEGPREGDYIRLSPSTDSAEDRYFAVDVYNNNTYNVPAGYRWVHPATGGTSTDWWNNLSASIKAEGYGVEYNASAGTASFVVKSYMSAETGNRSPAFANFISGSPSVPARPWEYYGSSSFNNTGLLYFDGGINASGSRHGDSITVAGTTFDLANTGVATATRVLTTGSGVTSESMFEDLRSKIATETGYIVNTASSGIPRVFSVTSSTTGSGLNPNISKGGFFTSFGVINAGSSGATEYGAEVGDAISIGGETFTIVNGEPSSFNEVSFTGSSAAFRSALSQSIRVRTVFDTINIVDLGNGYHSFRITSSVAGSGSNHVTLSNTNPGIRATFKNLVNTSGGVAPGGIEDGDELNINGIRFKLTASSETDTPEIRYIQTTGNIRDIWENLRFKMATGLSGDYNVTVDTGSYFPLYAQYELEAKETGSVAKFSTFAETGSSFKEITTVDGTDESHCLDRDRLQITSSFILYITAGASPADSAGLYYAHMTGTSQAFWHEIQDKINSNTQFLCLSSNDGNIATFSLTASATGSGFHPTFVPATGSEPARSFFSFNSILGGTFETLETFGPDNVIQIPRTDLTGSERNINTRFSAPGGTEVQTIGYLDAYTSTYSVHNAMPFRNLSVLGSGSGESTTIRVEDHLGLRRGLRTLRGLHQGRFGVDSQYGVVTSTSYPSSGSYNKQHRNKSKIANDSEFDASIRFPRTQPPIPQMGGLITAASAYDSTSFPPTGAKSFSYWINFDEMTNGQYIFQATTDLGNSESAIDMSYHPLSGIFQFRVRDASNNYSRWQYNFTPTVGVWYNFFVAWDGVLQNAPVILVNGITLGAPMLTDENASGGTMRQVQKLQIGDLFSPSTYEFQGRLSHFVIYKNNTTANAATLYNAGTPLSSSLPSEADIIDFWFLGNETNLKSKRLEGVGANLHGTIYFTSITGNNTPISTTSADAPTIAKGVKYTGVELFTANRYDNMYINSPIPRSEFQYSWIHAATSGQDIPEQVTVGYASRTGLVSSSADGYIEAVVFPSASSIKSV